MKGKCALITGSTAGLGAAIAARLAAEGCHIVLNGLGDPARVEVQRSELQRAHGVRVVYHGADLAVPGRIADMMHAAIETFGAIDILVNNAVVRHFAPVHEFPIEAWDRAMAVNISAAFHTIRLALPGMRARNWGRIINMSSVYGLFATVDRIDYVTRKTALIGMTRAVALECAGHDITCNAVNPGTVLTPAIEERLLALMAAERLTREAAVGKYLSTRQPSGRFIAEENVAALVAFLCSDAGRDVTGATLPMDGGWSAS